MKLIKNIFFAVCAVLIILDALDVFQNRIANQILILCVGLLSFIGAKEYFDQGKKINAIGSIIIGFVMIFLFVILN